MNRKINPWTLVSKKTSYDNDWIRVEHHEVLNPNNKPGIYGKVHFKNYAIGIIALDEDLNTWIVGQYRYTLDQYSWEIPMGGGPVEENVLASAQRELREETGMTAESWERLLEIHTSNCVTDEWGVVYVARDLKFGKPRFDDTEKLQIRKLPFHEVLHMAMSGEITDAISLAGIFKLHVKMHLDEE